jgi:5-methylcytosine-specific restriction protein A
MIRLIAITDMIDYSSEEVYSRFINHEIHGVWELYQDSQGKWTFREIIAEYEKFSIEINLASQLTSKQRLEVLATASKMPELMMVTSREFKRNPYVVAEVLFRADGKCQYCKRDAPFKREDGTPFLEVHHIEWLSRGGEDSVENAIALCPNCHRQAHYGKLELTPVNK